MSDPRQGQPSAERVHALIAEQAAEWLVRLQDPEVAAGDRVKFAGWLRASPVHVSEFLYARAMWEGLSREALGSLPGRDELMRLAEAGEAEIIPLVPRRQVPLHVPVRRRGLAAALSAVVIGGLLASGYWALGRFGNHAAFSTGIGEQETYLLRDGSTVSLNTRSRVRLDWSDEFRDAYLDDGEALFKVAKDPSRPFRVWSDASMVRAVGTRFNVYRAEDSVTVTVLEGRVEVTPDAPTSAVASDAKSVAVSDPPIALVAGEQTRIEHQGPVYTQRLERPEKAIAWQERRLEFERTPLAEVIAEFNRYHAKPLVLEDPALATKRINGIFDPADRASLVRFLEEFEAVEVEARPDAVLVRARAGDG